MFSFLTFWGRQILGHRSKILDMGAAVAEWSKVLILREKINENQMILGLPPTWANLKKDSGHLVARSFVHWTFGIEADRSSTLQSFDQRVNSSPSLKKWMKAWKNVNMSEFRAGSSLDFPSLELFELCINIEPDSSLLNIYCIKPG